MISLRKLGTIVFLCALYGQKGLAGELKETTELKQSEPESDRWEFKLAAPGWLAGAWGVVGVHEKNSSVDVPASTIFTHLTAVGALSAEATKGRFDIYGDWLYLGDQAGVYPGGIVSKIDLKFNETIADLDAGWRVIDTPKGWLEVLIGVRYMNVYSRLQLHPDDVEINAQSVQFVNIASAYVKRLLDRDLRGVLDGQNPVLPDPPLAADLEPELVQLIQKAKQDPALVAAILSGDSAKIAQAKAAVARHIANILQNKLKSTFSLGRQWADPYIGVRGRYNLNRAFYLTAKVDVGGFDAGSQVSVEAIGAIGCQITRRIWGELGYKYLYVDYRQGGFIYDVSTGGAMLTAGLSF